jgi:hypothetical protein
MRRVLPAVALVAVLGGCAGGADERARKVPPPTKERTTPRTGASDERLIRGWITALNGGRYVRAASYFARGAIVDQGQEIHLSTRAAAIVFNRSLPCKADLTDLKDEGSTTLAAFRLRKGRGGPGARCDGGARVRFRIRRGKFTEWRQLPESAAPPGQSA